MRKSGPRLPPTVRVSQLRAVLSPCGPGLSCRALITRKPARPPQETSPVSLTSPLGLLSQTPHPPWGSPGGPRQALHPDTGLLKSLPEPAAAPHLPRSPRAAPSPSGNSPPHRALYLPSCCHLSPGSDHLGRGLGVICQLRDKGTHGWQPPSAGIIPPSHVLVSGPQKPGQERPPLHSALGH